MITCAERFLCQIKGERTREDMLSSEEWSGIQPVTWVLLKFHFVSFVASRDSSPVMRSSSTLPVPQPSSAPPTPTRLTGANSDVEEEERGDLIQFYNNVYTDRIKDFALKYSPASGVS